MFDSLSDRLTSALKKLTGRGVLRPEDVDLALREVRLALLEADVNFKVVKVFVDRIRSRLIGVELSASLSAGQQVIKVVNDELVQLLGGNAEGLRYADSGPTVVMLVGLQGAGKTTTAIKLALLARREGHKPMLVALDQRRPAAVEQLRVLAAKDSVEFATGIGPAVQVALTAIQESMTKSCDFVILDTAGRQQLDPDLMEELRQLRSALPITEVLLVADAMTGQEAVNVGEAFHQALGVDGVILTKLDGDARGGAALSLRQATGQQVRFAGTGERSVDFEVFHADRMASRILGMGDVLTLIERAELGAGQQSIKDVERQIRKGQFTFDDYLAQIRQLRKLGPIEKVMEMLPGAGKFKGQLSGSERDVSKMEAVILSMTKEERAQPQVIDGSRRRRIARGSGTQVADVNRVLKAREMMQQLFKQMGRRGRRGAVPQLPGMF